MNLTRCSNGHYYDSDTYASCPHCAGGQAAQSQNKTVAYSAEEVKTVGGSSQGLAATVDLENFGAGGMTGGSTGPAVDLSQMTGGAAVSPDPDDGKTISIYQMKKNQDSEEAAAEAPVVGWLVCTKGKSFGRDYRLKSGRNFVGRSSQMDVCLAGENTVSRDRHAIIIHEPRKNIFIAQPGESRELFYVNGDVVLSSVQIKKNDVIQLGDVSLMLIPCCDEAFSWDKED